MTWDDAQVVVVGGVLVLAVVATGLVRSARTGLTRLYRRLKYGSTRSLFDR